jgi:hypothetical protein
MGKVKNQIEFLRETCEQLYAVDGSSAVIDFIGEAMQKGDDFIVNNVVYERCDACDADMPSLNHECLVCGQETKPTKQNLVDAVIESLKADILAGDVTVLDELLNKLSIKTLVQSLPEEQWDEFKELNSSYFEIMRQDYFEDAGREEIQIHAGENGNIFIFQDDGKLGFIIDVYGQNDHHDTMQVWEEDLEDGTEDMDKDDNGNCLYCGKKCWDGEMCDEQQAGGFS